VGTVADQYIQELKLKMKQVFTSLKDENERQSAS